MPLQLQCLRVALSFPRLLVPTRRRCTPGLGPKLLGRELRDLRSKRGAALASKLLGRSETDFSLPEPALQVIEPCIGQRAGTVEM